MVMDETRRRMAPPTTALIASLPATTPFVGPEAIERRLGRSLLLRLGANESVFGPSPRVVEAMRAAVGEIAYYGDPECFELRAALAARHGVALGNIAIASGIDDALGLLARVYLDRGEVAVMSLGGYPTFAYHVVGYGGRLERAPYRDDRNDLDALVEVAERTRARLLYLANPDNPSGSWRSAADIEALVERLPVGCLLVLDEAYSDFAPPDALPVIAVEDARVVRLRTFSKAYGMAGARVGYVIGTAQLVATFEKVRHHFGVNRAGLVGAQAALEDAGYVAGVVAEVAEGRAAYGALARDLGMRALPSATNFVAVDVGGVERARALVEALAQEGVFIRMPGAAPLDRCIRVTVGTAEQRALFGEIMGRVWGEVAGRVAASAPVAS